MPEGSLPAHAVEPDVDLPADDPLVQLAAYEGGLWAVIEPKISEELAARRAVILRGKYADVGDYREACGYVDALAWVMEVANDER